MQQLIKRNLIETLDENDREREAAGIGGLATAHYTTPDLVVSVERLSDGQTFTLYWRLLVTTNTTILRDKTAQEIRLALNTIGVPTHEGWVTDKDREEAIEIMTTRYHIQHRNPYK